MRDEAGKCKATLFTPPTSPPEMRVLRGRQCTKFECTAANPFVKTRGVDYTIHMPFKSVAKSTMVFFKFALTLELGLNCVSSQMWPLFIRCVTIG